MREQQIELQMVGDKNRNLSAENSKLESELSLQKKQSGTQRLQQQKTGQTDSRVGVYSYDSSVIKMLVIPIYSLVVCIL